MSSKIANALIIMLTAITLSGIVIGFVNYSGQDKYINDKEIVINEKTEEKMQVNLSGIAPGESFEYTLSLKANSGEKFNISMDFLKTGDDALASFVDVEVFLKGESVSKAKLSEHLGGEKISFSAEFPSEKRVEIKIVYSMDISVGDEAQGTKADFDILLKTER